MHVDQRQTDALKDLAPCLRAQMPLLRLASLGHNLAQSLANDMLEHERRVAAHLIQASPAEEHNVRMSQLPQYA